MSIHISIVEDGGEDWDGQALGAFSCGFGPRGGAERAGGAYHPHHIRRRQGSRYVHVHVFMPILNQPLIRLRSCSFSQPLGPALISLEGFYTSLQILYPFKVSN